MKLGLRRFSDPSGDGVILSLKLVIVDSTDRSAVREIARVPGTTAVHGDAITPSDDFLSFRAQPGLIFQGGLADGVEARVSRTTDGLVVEARAGVDKPWVERIKVPLAAGDLVRGAPYAKGRYIDFDPTLPAVR